MRTEPRRTGPAEPASVEVGRMKSEVIIRFRSGREEIPWGLNPSSGGVTGHSWNIDTVPKWLETKCKLPSNSATRPGSEPSAAPICVIRKPPFLVGKKSSVMLDCTALVENRNFGFFAAVTSKK